MTVMYFSISIIVFDNTAATDIKVGLKLRMFVVQYQENTKFKSDIHKLPSRILAIEIMTINFNLILFIKKPFIGILLTEETEAFQASTR